jgi:hypothetical protein
VLLWDGLVILLGVVYFLEKSLGTNLGDLLLLHLVRLAVFVWVGEIAVILEVEVLLKLCFQIIVNIIYKYY